MKTKGLGLIEALASGRLFKRPYWTSYAKGPNVIGVGVGGLSQAVGLKRADDQSFPLDPDDITATDYELEPETKLLTRCDIRDALRGRVCVEDIRQIIKELFETEEDV